MDPHAMRATLSTYLVPVPSLLSGLARLLDLGGQLDVYNSSASAGEADAIATYADWRMVGQDLSRAMEAGRPG